MADESKYVVLAGSIGSFCFRGDVVSKKFFAEHGVNQDRIEHFISRGTVREASNLEARHDKVDLDNESTTLTVESRLAAANRRLEALAKENSELQAKLQAVEAAKSQSGPPNDTTRFDKLVAEKDSVIQELQRKLKQLEGQQKKDKSEKK